MHCSATISPDFCQRLFTSQNVKQRGQRLHILEIEFLHRSLITSLLPRWHIYFLSQSHYSYFISWYKRVLTQFTYPFPNAQKCSFLQLWIQYLWHDLFFSVVSEIKPSFSVDIIFWSSYTDTTLSNFLSMCLIPVHLTGSLQLYKILVLPEITVECSGLFNLAYLLKYVELLKLQYIFLLQEWPGYSKHSGTGSRTQNPKTVADRTLHWLSSCAVRASLSKVRNQADIHYH